MNRCSGLGLFLMTITGIVVMFWLMSGQKETLKIPPAEIGSSPPCEQGSADTPDSCGDQRRAVILPENPAAPFEASDVSTHALLPVADPPPNFNNLSPELQEQVRAAASEYQLGHYAHAAMLALDTLDKLNTRYSGPDNSLLILGLYAGAGLSYEKLGYTDLAVEQFQKVLALDPGHRGSIDAMRRLDPVFVARHLALPGTENTGASAQTGSSAATNTE